MTNLVILSRFEKKGDIAPAESICVCNRHYETEKAKRDLSNFEESRVNSSMPETWCEICNPNMYNPKYWGF
jgi:hypothetical protein